MDKKIWLLCLVLLCLVPLIKADCIGTFNNFTVGQTITESCSLNKSENVTVDSTYAYEIVGNTITVNCNGNTIYGNANNTIGFFVGYADNLEITNCTFINNQSNPRSDIFEGIKATDGVISFTIYNNTFLNNTRAIRIENGYSSVNISKNILSGGEVAIILWFFPSSSVVGAVISDNNITNFNTSYYWNAVVNVRYVNDNLEIYNNYIEAGFNPPVLELSIVNNSEVYNNILIGNTQHMNVNLITGSSYNHIYNNTIIAGTDGIFLTGSNNLIEQNNITGQVHHNLVLYTHPSVDNDVANNTITNNNFDLAVINGMITADMGAGDIYNNTISYNNITEYGITGIQFDYTGTTYGTSDNFSIDHNFISSDEGGNLHNGFIGTSDNNLNFSSNYINFSEQYSFYYTCPYDDRNLILENNTFRGSEVLISNTYGALINNNSILNSESYGLDIQGGGDNIISNNYINSTNGDGFMTGIGLNLVDTGNNNISNTLIDNSILYDIQGSMSQDNNLINCTFDTLDVIDGARVFVKWYLDTLVTDGLGSPINSAIVTAYDVDNNLIFNETTNSSGYVSRKNLTEYIKDSSTTDYYTNYTVNASKGVLNATKKLNLTTNNINGIFFLLLGDSYPIITFNNTNLTVSRVNNITINSSVYSPNGISSINYTLYSYTSISQILNFSQENVSLLCYQESPTVSNQSGTDYCYFPLNYTGTQTTANTWTAVANIYDGNWASITSYSSGTPALIQNYTKPINAINMTWRVKDYGAERNLTIPSDCFNYYSDRVRVNVTVTSTTDSYYCYNGSWNLLYNRTGIENFYEEGVFWEINNSKITTINKSWFSNLSNGIYYYKIDAIDLLSDIKSNIYYFVIDNDTSTLTANYTNPVITGSNQTFTLRINKQQISHPPFPNSYNLFSDVNATLWYNGSMYNATKTSTATYYQFTTSLIVPNITSIYNETKQFYWNYTKRYYNTATLSTNTSIYNQTVSSFSLSNCSGLYNRLLFNFTNKDEETQLTTGMATASKIDIDLTIADPLNESNYLIYYGRSTNNYSLYVCGLNQSYNGYLVNATLSFDASGHVVENYYLDRYNISDPAGIPQNISLIDLNITDSTSYLVTVYDEDYLYLQEAFVQIWRYYINEGQFKLVEIAKTDNVGQTRVHLVSEDVIYKVVIIKGGETLYSGDQFLATCQASPCQININLGIGVTNFYDPESTYNLDYEIVSNETLRTTTLTYNTIDGSNANIVFNVTKKFDLNNNVTVCSDSGTLAGGTLNCTVPAGLSNTTYNIIITKDGQIIHVEDFNLNPNPKDTLGQTGIVMAMVVVLMTGLMAVSSGVLLLVFTLIGLITASSLLFLNMPYGTLIWIIVAIIIVIIKFTNKN